MNTYHVTVEIRCDSAEQAHAVLAQLAVHGIAHPETGEPLAYRIEYLMDMREV